MLQHLREHPEIYQQLEKQSATLTDGVLAKAKEHRVPLCANRVGSMLTWFFQLGPVHDWGTAAKSDTQAFAAFHRAMLDRGVYLPPSQFEALFVSAAHTDGDIARTIEAAGHAFEQ